MQKFRSQRGPIWHLSLLVFIALFQPAPAHADSSIVSRWEARAVQATAQLHSLNAKLQQVGADSREAQVLVCQAMVEAGFAMYLTARDIVYSKDETLEYFHLYLVADKEVFDVMYSFDRRGKVKYTRIDRVPEGWQIYQMPDRPLEMLVTNPKRGCEFGFRLLDPFFSFALED